MHLLILAVIMRKLGNASRCRLSLGGLAGIVILALSWVAPAGAGFPEIVAQIKPSIVGVGTVLPTRRPPVALMGTGFVIGDGHYVVTNAHVVPELTDSEKREQLSVFVGTGATATHRAAQTVLVDKEHDLALLRISGPAIPSLTLGYEDDAREGQEIAFTGFPIGAVLGLYPVTHHGIISSITPIVIPAVSAKDLDSKMLQRLKQPFDIFQLDATAYPGNSGSPLYSPITGRVIGIINMVFVKETKEKVLEHPSGITYAIPVSYLRDLLKRAEVVF